MQNQRLKAEIITEYIKKNNISKTVFCKLCKISRDTLNKILENDHNFGILALFKIARVLNIHVHELFTTES